MALLFISDLHLHQKRPKKLELFEALLKKIGSRNTSLYILGDLFDDFWLDINKEEVINKRIVTLLHRYTCSKNTQLFIMRGNHDLYLNERFAQATGATLLDDFHHLEINHKKILLTHGDLLCTKDIGYQKWRKLMTHDWCKRTIHLLQKMLSTETIRSIRAHADNYISMKAQRKTQSTTDVCQQTVQQKMQEYASSILIHGHTHRQGIHTFELNKRKCTRIVLGDWYKTDSVLVMDESNAQFQIHRATHFLTQELS